jgi:RNA polymerase sigma factor (sigma-70 family)
MADSAPAASTAMPEPQILRARAEGRVSPDASFEQLYGLYAPLVAAWFQVRVSPDVADDLFQDVWTIFFNRWQRWELLPEMMHPDAKPVLSFLFRTAHFVLIGYRRQGANRPQESLDEIEMPDRQRSPERMQHHLEVGRTLALARKLCPPEEMDVLLAKLAGVPAREIARTLAVSEPVVDHRFRNAVARLRQQLKPRAPRTPRKKGGRHA